MPADYRFIVHKSVEEFLNTLDTDMVGRVVGESTSTKFLFAVDPGCSRKVPRWEYVVTQLGEGVIVAQVHTATAYSALLQKEIEYKALQRLASGEIETPKHWRLATVLTYVENHWDGRPQVSTPKHPVLPGSPVYIAPDQLIEKLYAKEGEGLYVGNLVTRRSVCVKLSIAGFRRHLAIIAQTGAGKSYLAGVLMEELLAKGATIIVLDPHADYVRMGVPNSSWDEKLSRRVTVYRVSHKPGRFTDIRNIRRLAVRFSDLSLDELFYLAGMDERFTQIRRVVAHAYKKLKQEKEGVGFNSEDLVQELSRLSEIVDKQDRRRAEHAYNAQTYVGRIAGLGIFGEQTTPVEEILKPKTMSVIDLSGLTDREADLISYLILKKIFTNKSGPPENAYQYPVFIFIEEAHRFIPPENVRTTWSSQVIKQIASEGRKFGVFLTLITQRPSKVHPDALSQCNSQIIMRITNPLDQKAVMEASERLGEELFEDLPGLDKGEAIVVGDIVNLPAIISVRKRRSYEGGADIDVDSLLSRALHEAEKEEDDRFKRGMDWDEYKRRFDVG
jgi:DNA helicase HerA-like ATPase